MHAFAEEKLFVKEHNTVKIVLCGGMDRDLDTGLRGGAHVQLSWRRVC